MMKENTFATLLNEYNVQATIDINSKETTQALLSLSRACALSILKKLSDPQRNNTNDRKSADNSGCNPVIVSMRGQIMHDSTQLDNLEENVNSSVHVSYNQDGDEIKTWDDIPFAHERLSDGTDLVQTAVVCILSESHKQLEKYGYVDLEKTYITRKLSKKVYINDTDERKFENVDTTPIQETYRSIRRYVMDNRALNIDPRCKYVYLSEITYDDESDVQETVYRRLPKEWQLVDTMDIHGVNKTVSMASATRETVNKVESIIESLNLTTRQREVLKYRLRGYGYKVIANHLGVSQRAIAKTCEQIQKKCVTIGFVPENMK